MNKSFLVIAICLGLLAGLLWPLNQDQPPQPEREVIIEPIQPAEPAAIEPPLTPKKQEPETSPSPQPNPESEPETEPDPQPETKPEPSPQLESKSEPAPPQEPQERVVKGQTPEEVIRSFRRSPPLERKITQFNLPKTSNSQPASSSNPQPSIKPPKAEPVGGNYCYLAYGYDDWPADVAFAICMGESSGQPTAVNPRDKHHSCTGSYGLFQIACFWANPNDMLDPHQNIEKARWLYQKSGWSPWGAYSNGSYQRHLP